MITEITFEENTIERIKFIMEHNKNVSVSSIINEAVKRLYTTELNFTNRQRFDKGEELFQEI